MSSTLLPTASTALPQAARSKPLPPSRPNNQHWMPAESAKREPLGTATSAPAARSRAPPARSAPGRLVGVPGPPTSPDVLLRSAGRLYCRRRPCGTAIRRVPSRGLSSSSEDSGHGTAVAAGSPRRREAPLKEPQGPGSSALSGASAAAAAAAASAARFALTEAAAACDHGSPVTAQGSVSGNSRCSMTSHLRGAVCSPMLRGAVLPAPVPQGPASGGNMGLQTRRLGILLWLLALWRPPTGASPSLPPPPRAACSHGGRCCAGWLCDLRRADSSPVSTHAESRKTSSVPSGSPTPTMSPRPALPPETQPRQRPRRGPGQRPPSSRHQGAAGPPGDSKIRPSGNHCCRISRWRRASAGLLKQRKASCSQGVQGSPAGVCRMWRRFPCPCKLAEAAPRCSGASTSASACDAASKVAKQWLGACCSPR
mmetsp:Transcript_95641/g.303644  ORF Transcript_95641/g.303644 Transcript_95641/m.303644 type:complete len:426 (-) Transcript_95641:46-1323(-)